MNRKLMTVARHACAASALALVSPANLALAAPATEQPLSTIPSSCAGRDRWEEPSPPARIYANTWYVGTCGISAVLITSDEGHILVDSGVEQAAPMVLKSIKSLEFSAKDVRWIVTSHAHFDHAGALAKLKKATGAKIAALAEQKVILESGTPALDDPQLHSLKPIQPVSVDRTLGNGESITVGAIVITAHATPVHAPDSTSWTWQSCASNFDCKMIAYADSSSTISSKGYRFTDNMQRQTEIRSGLARMAELPCDILLTPHPSASAMMPRFAGDSALVNPTACRTYAAEAEEKFNTRLQREKNENDK